MIERVVRRRVGDPAAGEADHEDPALERDALARPVERVAAHGVVDHVGAAAVGQALHRVDEVVGEVVDHDIGTEVATDLHLLGTARRREHARSGRAPELDRG